ncbi:uncharacterized protein LOC105694034 [Athalia rosae]|uniref:uncharacterized protein LOC105694034 n=1 Tax=Athalia rosae TaxID=37344 RepID=UPI000625B0D4|nr:uncharacterized protein LOC105694034 [Athalia rosae]
MSENNAIPPEIVDLETPSQLKSNHRRSTFFRRHSTLQINDDGQSKNVCNNENPDATVTNGIQTRNADNHENNASTEQPFDLEKYINRLEHERSMWKQTLLERKRQYKSLLKQSTNQQQHEQDLDLSVLSENERTFLLVRPNYEHICVKANNLSTLAAEITILNDHVTHLHNRSILRAQKKLDNLTSKVMKMID